VILNELTKELQEYCLKYDIPIEHLMEILEDQKVTPMIRGKATEYNALRVFRENLSVSEWICDKLNLSAQQTTPDQDISITHRRTGITLKAESKNAARGSMKSGSRSRINDSPHFRVKCHRSRSNIKLANSSNDRYAMDSFDVLIANPYNAIIKGKTIGPSLEMIDDVVLVEILLSHYNASDEDELLAAIKNDWRFVLPERIAIGGFIPRTPYVLLSNDPNWLGIQEIEATLKDLVAQRSKRRHR